MSARYYGCDAEAKWMCEEHQAAADLGAWAKWAEPATTAGAVGLSQGLPVAPTRARCSFCDAAKANLNQAKEDFEAARVGLEQQVATLTEALKQAENFMATAREILWSALAAVRGERHPDCTCKWDLPDPFTPDCPVHGPKE